MIHALAHLFKQNKGWYETISVIGQEIVCFRCAGCGLLQDFQFAARPESNA